MTPTVQDASTAIVAETPLPESILGDGEIVILAIKPSRWFVLLVAWPVLWAAVLVALLAAVAGDSVLTAVPKKMIWVVCSAAACVRTLLACAQWLGRWYILTNLRLIQVRGVLRMDIVEHNVASVDKTFVYSALSAKVLPGVGSLLFDTAEGVLRPPAWIHIARPQEVEQVVDQVIRRARRMSQG